MKHKPDDRSDNVERIQENINHTIRNMEAARDMMDKSLDDKVREELKEKNRRRQQALDKMRIEIADEARFQKERERRERSAEGCRNGDNGCGA
jgi:small acid-soluble spore protein (thioredoxin-like protein)